MIFLKLFQHSILFQYLQRIGTKCNNKDNLQTQEIMIPHWGNFGKISSTANMTFVHFCPTYTFSFHCVTAFCPDF